MTSTMGRPSHLTLDRALATGVTYRQLDYWCRLGAVVPSNPGRGSGSHRVWSERDIARLRTVVAYANSGLFYTASATAIRALWDHLEAEPFRARDLAVWVGTGVEVPTVVDAAGPVSPGSRPVLLLHHEGRA